MLIIDTLRLYLHVCLHLHHPMPPNEVGPPSSVSRSFAGPRIHLPALLYSKVSPIINSQNYKYSQTSPVFQATSSRLFAMVLAKLPSTARTVGGPAQVGRACTGLLGWQQ